MLLARSSGPWWTSLSAEYPEQATLIDSLTRDARNVIVLDVAADDRAADAIVADAATQFGAHLGRPVPAVPPRSRPAGLSLLRLHAEALLAVLDGHETASGPDIIGEMIGHEARYWLRVAPGETPRGRPDQGHHRRLEDQHRVGAGHDRRPDPRRT